MTHHTRTLAALFCLFCYTLLNTATFNSAYAEQNKTTASAIYGKVTDIINAAGYTYAEVDTGEEKVWAAGPSTPLKNGDMIAFSTRMPMKNFHSKSMQRDFDILYFVDRFTTDNDVTSATPEAINSPHNQAKQKPAVKNIKPVDKVSNGNTIAEIYADKQNLNGKLIRVRGQVTKYTANILGKNWLHIMDNSTTNDLTITSDNTAEIDDIVIIEGKLELNKDFGAGYLYPLIVENAKIR